MLCPWLSLDMAVCSQQSPGEPGESPPWLGGSCFTRRKVGRTWVRKEQGSALLSLFILQYDHWLFLDLRNSLEREEGKEEIFLCSCWPEPGIVCCQCKSKEAWPIHRVKQEVKKALSLRQYCLDPYNSVCSVPIDGVKSINIVSV